MSATNAHIKTATLIALMKRMRPGRSMLIRGNHGIGKSDIVRQVARFFDAHLLDFRLGQRTPGDIIGMPDPDKELGTTRFLPPAELKRACTERCVLFFDELNRAVDEVLQAVFQICLDRRLPDGTPLHPETRVYAAINMAAIYNVGRLDPALLDRFAVFDLLGDVQDWLKWARRPTDHAEGGGGIADVICDFVAAHPDMLFPATKCEPESVQPTPRSWAFTNDDLVAAGVMDVPKDPLFYAICVANLGVEVASPFVRFAESIDNRISGQDVLNSYSSDPTGETFEYVLRWKDKAGNPQTKSETWQVGKLQAKVRRMTMDSRIALVDALGQTVSAMTAPGTKEQGENIRRFCADLDPELKVNLWAAFTAKGVDDVETAKWWHPCIAEDIVTGAFGVPVGEEGIGVTPNIPQALAGKTTS